MYVVSDNRVLTLGLPAFYSPTPILFPVKLRSTNSPREETGKALLSVNLTGFLVLTHKFICLYVFLFECVCILQPDHLYDIMQDIMQDPLQPSMHAHDLAFMRFLASR